MRTTCSVSLCVAVVTALHVAAPAEESLKGLWVPHSEPVKPTDVLTFHVYWTLNDERASRSRCHEKGAAGSQAVLDCKVRALAPVDSAVAATKAWLEPARKYCSYTWNAVHCREVPVGVTESLFGMATGSITSWCKRTACNTAGAPQAHRYLAAGSASATVPRECQVDSISGVHLHDYVRKSARHMGQVRADSRITAAKAPSLEPNARTPQLPPPYTGYVPQPEGDFGAPTLFFGLPFVLGADEWFVTVIPACQFGSSLIYSNVTAFSQWCSASFDTPPSSFTVTYTDLNSGVVQYTSRQYYPSELYNTSAARLLTTGADQTNYAVFFIPAAPSSTFFSWQQLNINVTAFYAPGTSSASTQTNSMSAFWDGETYTAGFNESPTDNGWTAATMPLAAVTMPSPTYNEPSDLRSAYGVPVGATASGQVAGVVEFTDVAYPQGGLSATDVQYFLSNISATGTYSIIGNASIVSAGETTLDIELMLGVATGVKAYVYCLEYGGRQYNQYSDAMEAFASTAFAQQDTTGLFKFGPSTVWSISYGGPEWIDTQTNIPDPQLLRVNTLFKHLTDAGITVVASSGDSGSVWLGEFPAKLVNFPASSPYVVGVGATARRLNGGEMACSAQEGNVITSGGGYSSAFVPEAWQAMSLPAANRTRAGVPDVAANGAFIYTVLGGTTTALFGTSASSPIIASFIAIINNQTIAKNASHGTLRQATYFLYNRTTVNGGQSNANFNDITDGNNCAGNHGASLSNNYAIYGPNDCYSAGVGWDPVTGLGTPQVSAWIAASYDWSPPSFDSAPDDSDSDSWIHIGIGAGVVVGIVFGVLFVCAIRRQRKQAQNRGQHRSGSSQPGAQSVAFSAVGTPVSGGDTPQPTGAYSAMKAPTAAESV